jgi:hypothetical protein
VLRSPSSLGSIKVVCLMLVLSGFRRTNANQFSNDQDTVLTEVRNFLHAAYPELFDKGCFLEMSILQPIDESWRRVGKVGFQVDRYDPQSKQVLNPPFDPKTGKRLPLPENVLCRGSMRFDNDGRLDQFSIGDVPTCASKTRKQFRR